MSNLKTRITNEGIKFLSKDNTEVFSQLTANINGEIEIGSASETSVTIGAETGLEVKRNATFRNVIMSKNNQNNKAFDIDFKGMLESIINSTNFYELRSSLINSLTIYQDLEVLMGQNIRTKGVPSQTISASKTFINVDALDNIIPFYIMSDISTEYPYTTTGTIEKKKNDLDNEIKLTKPNDAAERRTLKSRLTQIYNANTDSNIGNILRHTNITDIEDAKLLFPLKYELNLYNSKQEMLIYKYKTDFDTLNPPNSIDSFVVQDEKLAENTYWTINSLDTNDNSSITTILFGKRIKNMLYIFKENNTPLVFTYGTDQEGINTYYGTALTDFDRIEINYQIQSAPTL